MLDQLVIVFIDDMLVFSKTKEHYEKHLREFLKVSWRKKLYTLGGHDGRFDQDWGDDTVGGSEDSLCDSEFSWYSCVL